MNEPDQTPAKNLVVFKRMGASMAPMPLVKFARGAKFSPCTPRGHKKMCGDITGSIYMHENLAGALL